MSASVIADETSKYKGDFIVQEMPDEMGCPLESRRVWSLLDLIRYAVRDLYALLLWMEHEIAWTHGQEQHRQGDAALLSASERNSGNNQMVCIAKHSGQLELASTKGACNELIGRLKGKITLGEYRGQLIGIRRMLTEALQGRSFMYVPVHLSKYVNKSQFPTVITSQLGHGKDTAHVTGEWFDPDAPVKPFGEKVFEVFPHARYDAEHAALCLAAGAHTAAVFHMMRAVEWGVRYLGKELGLQRIKEVVKAKPGGKYKQDRVRLTPIQNCVWEKIECQIRKKVDARLAKLRPGPAKDKKQAFYSSVLSEFHGFREAWRNHVMHSRKEVEAGDDLKVMGHVTDFMVLLASGRDTPNGGEDKRPHSETRRKRQRFSLRERKDQ
jgi:hypothetical protein